MKSRTSNSFVFYTPRPQHPQLKICFFFLIITAFRFTPGEKLRELGLAHRVVKDLVAPYHLTGMRVYMDNFYTGVPLLRELATLRIGGCGTVRANRKFLPTELLPKRVRLDKRQHQSAQAGNLTFCVWQDTKAVCVSCRTSMIP